MRGLENLIKNKESIFCYDIVEKALKDLYLIRDDKDATEKYFNDFLFADARCRSLTNNYNGDLVRGDFVENEGEVDLMIALMIRKQILDLVCNDYTLIYVYNILVLGKNKYLNNYEIKCMEPKEINGKTNDNIRNTIIKYKECYPKNNLVDFFDDDINYGFYYEKNEQLQKDDDWWLNVFNLAYENFDLLRLHAHSTEESDQIASDISSNDKLIKKNVLEIIDYLFENYNYMLEVKQTKAFNLVGKLVKRKLNNLDVNCDVVAEPMKTKPVKKSKKKTLSCAQQVKAMILIMEQLKIYPEDTGKQVFANFIEEYTGRNNRNILKRMNYTFEKPQDRKDFNVLSAFFRPIIPKLADIINNTLDSARDKNQIK